MIVKAVTAANMNALLSRILSLLKSHILKISEVDKKLEVEET